MNPHTHTIPAPCQPDQQVTSASASSSTAHVFPLGAGEDVLKVGLFFQIDPFWSKTCPHPPQTPHPRTTAVTTANTHIQTPLSTHIHTQTGVHLPHTHSYMCKQATAPDVSASMPLWWSRDETSVPEGGMSQVRLFLHAYSESTMLPSFLSLYPFFLSVPPIRTMFTRPTGKSSSQAVNEGQRI